jgi:hypothetical protein
MGDIIPVDATLQTIPRTHFNTDYNFCSPNTLGNDTGLPEDSYTSSSPIQFEYEDENGDWIISSASWRLPGGNTIIDVYTQPNMHPSTPDFDIYSVTKNGFHLVMVTV